MRKLSRALFALLVFTFAAFAQNDERILAYTSDITVNSDASLLVTETITVRAMGQSIQRGIYRDFPTNYRTAWFTRFTTTFEVQNVLRNGQPEPHHIESISNGSRLYIGDANVFIPHGEHTYTITYRTKNQIAYWKDKDELYWNVTGNGWSFPIDSVEARVQLPRSFDAGELELNAYTGVEGSTEQAYTASMDPFRAIVFTSTRPFTVYEGLTISVAFPKGLIAQPTWTEELAKWAMDNKALRLCAFGIFLTILYFVFVWFLVGRDPKPGAITITSEPPKGLSPAAMRYIKRMGFDNKVFTAALLSLAVKKYITIAESGDDYKIERLKVPDEACSREEKAALNTLLPNGGAIELKQTNHKKVSSAIKSCHDALRGLYEKQYFITNYSYFLPGVVLGLGTIVLSAIFAPQKAGSQVSFLLIWITFWSLGCLALGHAVIVGWRSAFGGVGKFAHAVFITLFSIPFFGAEIFVLAMIFGGSAVWLLPIVVIVVALNWLFYQLLKAPTRLGRRALDQIDGFSMYLQGDKTAYAVQTARPAPEKFNEFFPYAVALGLDDEWAKQFESAVKAAKDMETEEAVTTTYTLYRPYWYRGSSWDRRGMRGFSGAIASSMASSISSASTAPGSSSGRSGGGGGGGGSSGGGGGGGGGGGW